jgi:hypothetical protein
MAPSITPKVHFVEKIRFSKSMIHFHEVLTKYSIFNFWKREYTKDKRDINIDNVWNT